ncbi:choline transporter-like protein 1 [Cimex lectularius]|uniref:Choline transporter-like protein n=1 Tax=Cimex lectularius TaxID=79782 RepID=A0A8I6RH79_CIMLE|nr:choline transporter-like protein 1 [Cimex lectularius]
MGCCGDQEKVEPNEGSDETRNNDKGVFKGPVSERSVTDVVGILMFIIFLTVLFGLLGHCIVNGDIYRVIYGYDNCGNICGMENLPEEKPEFQCKGGDFTKKKFLLIKEAGKALFSPKNVNKECVEDCKAYPEYMTFLNRCIPKKTAEIINNFVSKTGITDFFHEVSEDLHHSWVEIFYLSLISLILSVIVVFTLRFFAGFMIWAILIGSVVIGILGTIYSWIVWKQKKHDQSESDIDSRVSTTYLTIAIIVTIVTIVFFLIIVALRKRIKLVVELFLEAGKALNKMPLLLFEPILTFLALAGVVALWLYFSIWIESAGYLKNASPNYYYKKDFAMKFSRWYNLLAMFWMTQICIGCQHMIIAGAVATWFFTRNKEEMRSPISTSAKNLLRYHLGSVLLGSFFIALCQLLRSLFKYIESTLAEPKNDITKFCSKCCHFCLYCFEKILVYVTRNAYIEIAIYGHSFCRASHQSVQVLVSNVLRVAAINTIGDFVLLLAKAIVVIATVLMGTVLLDSKDGVYHLWVPLTLAGLFAYLIAHAFIAVYEMVIDTIFICFCEDCEINDGISKPYFMSKGLMEFVQNSKKVLKVGDLASPAKVAATELEESPSK